MNNLRAITLTLILACASASFAADFYVAPTGSATPPFSSWDTAATNIQDAIDAASAGDNIWVTNGVYAGGGKATNGNLTNRVALDKSLTVQSINGPFVTTIQGAWDPASTNGPLAVRGAWLTNGAVLKGFTVTGGATLTTGTVGIDESGGGVWCNSSNAVVSNCILETNAVAVFGGAAYGGTFRSCAISGNFGTTSAGATYGGILLNCTVVSNTCGGPVNASSTNCILYYNQSRDWSGGVLSHCCSSVISAGGGNTNSAPQLLADGIHLSSASPCLGLGLSIGGGTDIDGQPWDAPPSIGCDEFHGAPLLTLQPKVLFKVAPVGFVVASAVYGQDPLACAWYKDGLPLVDDSHLSGTQATNLFATGLSLLDAGSYQLFLTNTYGLTASAALQLVIHCVSAGATNPIAPYLDWSTAAATIQDAIDAAQPGEFVLVSDGVYTNGGRVMAGDLTNRVALNKSVMVQSVNGSPYTFIQGAWDPASTNGPLAVRCAWLTNNAVLSGFTLQGGATRNTGDLFGAESGGGVWASSSNALTANCLIRGNAALVYGGGAYQAGMASCNLSANTAGLGGGAYHCNLTNCTLIGNSAMSGGGANGGILRGCALLGNIASSGGGVEYGTLFNCTVVANSALPIYSPQAYGGGAYLSSLTNCIIYGNVVSPASSSSNYSAGILNWCCTAPSASGTGNISMDPQLAPDGIHLLSTSPCIGAGTAAVLKGTDIDGQPWASPPSIGCDEFSPVPSCTLPLQFSLTGFPTALLISGVPVGQQPLTLSWTLNGSPLNDSSKYGGTHTAAITVNGFAPADDGAYQLVASNGFGSCTSSLAVVVVHCADPNGAAPVAPYSDWSTAATNLQDAVDAAGWGEFVLATNGVYSTGGRVMSGDLTNRVAINGGIFVSSINGPSSATIIGARDPATGTGPLAVRCAWLGQGATVRGFTLRDGATRNTGDYFTLQSGGGAWCGSTNESLVNCVLTNNTATSGGGGAYQGQLWYCVLAGNSANTGGGAYKSFLRSSALFSNTAFSGGGAYGSFLVSCTVTLNSASPGSGGGLDSSWGWNSIIFGNLGGLLGQDNDWDLGSFGHFVSCWTTTSPSDMTTRSPQIVPDNIHIAATSPCRGAGNPAYLSGTDLDGEAWLNPPSIGCAEYYAADFTGPLALGPVTVRGVWSYPSVLRNGVAVAYSSFTGNADRLAWSFGDGAVLTNAYAWVAYHTWTNAGDFNVTFTAYNADNPNGVSTNALVHVALPDPPVLSANSLTGTTFTLTFPMQGGIRYYIDQTTNLAPPIAWETIGSVINDGYPLSTGVVADANATNAIRFYRIRAQ
ncbi:MAG TPA: hypothetical protein VG167_21705 [Verrucomicrobiae bacterium]|nr:hypothetical protein [Verrucomicrobiae bacterium]